VLVLGAGASGLAAAQDLCAAGLRVRVLEARERLGGRIHTLHHPGAGAPIELGAEFVHGVPEEIFGPSRAGAFRLRETGGGRSWQYHEGRLATGGSEPPGVDEIFARLERAAAGPDRSLQQFLEEDCAEPELAGARKRVLRYVSGYHAARPDRISIRALAAGEAADAEIHADRSFRVVGGYDQVIDWLRRDLPSGVIQLETVATTIRWRAGSVEVETIPSDHVPGGFGGMSPASPSGAAEDTGHVATASAGAARSPAVHTARRLVVTLPLGVLKQPPQAPGAVRFQPALREKEAALRGLEMGSVVKVVLAFREAFWERRLRFLSAPDEPFRAWWTQWTQQPDPAPLLTGWIGGPDAERLSREGDAAIIATALDELARIFSVDRGEIHSVLDAAHTHNWQADPFCRGAYSYVAGGGLAAQEELAQPVADTLFFAGEAADYLGQYSTVHGAIAAGRRAAAIIIRTLRQDAPPLH
jgi:hypothetical protein